MIKKIEEISGFEMCAGYTISTEGEVVSYKGSKPRVLKQGLNTKGYPQISIGNPIKTTRIHRLVALAFIDNPHNKPQVNHKDGNKQNNNIDNLEWATNGDNQIHAFAHGLNKPHKGELNYQYSGDHDNCKVVEQLDLNGNVIAEFKSLAIAGRSLNKGYSTISKCCNGKGETAYGFKWRFKQ